MNTGILVALLAVACCISADCGCLKVMSPAPMAHFYDHPATFQHDYKFQAPLALAPAPATIISAPAPTLKACVDRVVLPAPAHTIVNQVVSGSPTLISTGISPAYKTGRWLNDGCYNRGVDTIVAPAVTSIANPIVAPAVVSSGWKVAGPALGGLGGWAGYRGFGPYSSGYKYGFASGPILDGRYRSGPALDVIGDCGAKKIFLRYINALSPIVRVRYSLNFNKNKVQIIEIVSNNNCTELTNSRHLLALDIKNRKKREVPFINHGYKFIMNMLPDFIRQPIKNTVNTFALTHPDEKLQALYRNSKQLTLKERLLLQKKKNRNLFRKKLLGHHLKKGPIKKPYGNDYALEKEATIFLSNLEPRKSSKYPWPSKFPSRLSDMNDNLNFEHISSNKLEELSEEFNKHSKNSKDKPELTAFERALFLKKLQKLNEEKKRRTKRSTLYQNYRKKFRQEPDKPSVIIDSDELVVPFYQVKLEDSSDESQEHVYYYDNENDGAVSREEMLRKIIRRELQNYKIEQNTATNSVQEPFTFNSIIPHNPLFHLVNFPIRFIKKFNEISKQAFPVVSSVPKAIITSKKYFRDFGKNFRKNLLHLASDVIGDFDNLQTNNVLKDVIGRSRYKRSIRESKKDWHTDTKGGGTSYTEKDKIEPEKRKLEQYEPDYSLMFENSITNKDALNVVEDKVRRKRYILKMVDENEVEQFLMEKLGSYLTSKEVNPRKNGRAFKSDYYTKEDRPYYQTGRKKMISGSSEEDYGKKKVVLEQLKPKIIIDNNGIPFLEINGYKKPMLKKKNKSKAKQRKTRDSFEHFNPYYSSGEVDSETIGYLIDHAMDHVESSHNARFAEMPVKTIKEKMSQLLLETDMLVHMDFDKYDEIYDDLIALQNIKSSVEQDWKRLIMNNRIDDMNAKIVLLGKFQEMQHAKDMTVRGAAYMLNEANENLFITKKLIKILVRLQKLQCIINQVVENVQGKLHTGSKLDIRKEIKYVDFLSGLNFVDAKTRNEMINNLMKDRDVALQQNIELLDKFKKFLIYEHDTEKVADEASLLWEMKNIENMQRSTIEEMNQRLNDGYKIKKELKILFDLLKSYETCEMDQKKLLSQSEENSDGNEDEYSEEEEDSEEDVKITRNKKEIPKNKFDVKEFILKMQDRRKKRIMLLRKNLRKNLMKRKSKPESCKSDEEE